jgi:hypothetical protein
MRYTYTNPSANAVLTFHRGEPATVRLNHIAHAYVESDGHLHYVTVDGQDHCYHRDEIKHVAFDRKPDNLPDGWAVTVTGEQ